MHNTTDVYADRRRLAARVMKLEALVGELAGVCQGWIDFASESMRFRCLLASTEENTALLQRTDTALTRARGDERR